MQMKQFEDLRLYLDNITPPKLLQMLLLLSGERLRRGVLMLGLLGQIEFHQLPVLLIQQHLNSSNADISEPDAC